MSIELRVQFRDEPPREYHFDRDRIVLGCHPFNDLVVQCQGLSARHGQLALCGEGLRYEDLGSQIGTRLVHGGGSVVEHVAAASRPIETGDVLVLGAESEVRITILGFRSAAANAQAQGPECFAMPSFAPELLLDAVSEPLRRVLLAASGGMLSQRNLQATSRALQEIVAATVPQGVASFVVPQGEEAFHDRVVTCDCADGGAPAWVSPDPETVVAGLCGRQPMVQLSAAAPHDEEGGFVLRVPFVDERDGPRLLGYLRVQSPRRPSNDQIQALAASCAWMQPVLLTILTLDAMRAEAAQLMAENQYFRGRARRHYLFKELVNESRPMRALYEHIQELLSDDGGVLVVGEAGCGKKMIGRALHHLGSRRHGIFISHNCGESSEEELDRELFGAAGQRGLLELASGGTLFLDEIDRLPMRLQTKLLRVLLERELRREGEETSRHVDVRIVAATHRDLLAMARAGRFRRDLLGAFGDAILRVPPLRARGDDLLPLSRVFIERYNRRYGLTVSGVSADAAERLAAHAWQGNVRELQVVIETAVLKARDGEIEGRHLDLASPV